MLINKNEKLKTSIVQNKPKKKSRKSSPISESNYRLTFNLGGPKNKNKLQQGNPHQQLRIVNQTLKRDWQKLEKKQKDKTEYLNKIGGFGVDATKFRTYKLEEVKGTYKTVSKQFQSFKRDHTAQTRKLSRLNKQLRQMTNSKIESRIKEGKTRSEKIKITKLLRVINGDSTRVATTNAKRELNVITDKQYQKETRKRNRITNNPEGINATRNRLINIEKATSNYASQMSIHMPGEFGGGGGTVKYGEIEPIAPTFKPDIDDKYQEILGDDYKDVYEEGAEDNKLITRIDYTIDRVNAYFQYERDQREENGRTFSYFANPPSTSWMFELVQILERNGFSGNPSEFYEQAVSVGLSGKLDSSFETYIINGV